MRGNIQNREENNRVWMRESQQVVSKILKIRSKTREYICHLVCMERRIVF